MPIYEYECESCGKKFEVRQSIGQDGVGLKCPSCGATDPHRLFSGFVCASSNDFGGYSYSGGGSSCSTCSSGNCASCNL